MMGKVESTQCYHSEENCCIFRWSLLAFLPLVADDCNYLLFCSVVGPFWKCKSGKYMIKEELPLIVGDEEGLLTTYVLEGQGLV